jgi:hypothetical protein
MIRYTGAILAVLLAAAAAPSAAQTPVPVAPTAVATAAPWAWPTIPGCLADPGTSTAGSTDYNSPACGVFTALSSGLVADAIAEVSARRLNGEFDGVLYPAFLPGTEVIRFVTTARFSSAFAKDGDMRLVRVSGSRVGARSGSWWTTRGQISANGAPLPAPRIRSVLALLATPACMASAMAIPPGIVGYFGVTAPAFGEPGGGVEFWFPPGIVEASPAVVSIPESGGCPA